MYHFIVQVEWKWYNVKSFGTKNKTCENNTVLTLTWEKLLYFLLV